MSYYETISTWVLAITILAILVGPIAAVLVTRLNDDRREARRRKEEVLSTLMRTRQTRLALDHVWALNRIQLEFYGIEPVQAAYRDYISHLNQELPKEQPIIDRFIEERTDRFFELLHKIGRHLGYGFDKRDLQKLAYGPVGWENDENAIRMMRSLSLDMLTGKQSLSVIMRPSAAPSAMFPPPPSGGPSPAPPQAP